MDDSLLYCLEDGAALVQGAVPSPDEPQTAILHETAAPSEEAATRAQIHTTGQSAIWSGRAGDVPRAKSFDKRLIIAPVALTIVVLGGVFGYRYLGSSDSGQIRSIAVLPFENVGGNADSEYLSDGLAESLIYRLSQIPDLKVSPRSSVFRYKGQNADAEGVGNELGVDAVMSGRMIQRGDSLTISVDLIDVRNKKTLWGEQFERKMSDLLATQREIASAVTQKLQLKLAGNDRAVTKKYTSSNEAYQLYLRGRHAWNKRIGDSLKQAVDYYNQAIAADPSFALAYAGLAESYILFANYDVASQKDSLPLAKAAAMRALELDESLAEAHTAYAAYLNQFEFDYAGAEREFRRAIELDPNYATAHQWLGQMLSIQKRFDEGMAETRLAAQADPLSPVISLNLGWQHYWARRYDQALVEFDATAAKFPDFHVVSVARCSAFFAKNDLSNAVSECRKAREVMPDASNIGYLAMVLGRAGNTDEAEKLLEELNMRAKGRSVTPIAFAYAYIGLNRKEDALRMIEREVEERGYWATDVSVYPEYDEFRSDPRFKALLKEMNLPE